MSELNFPNPENEQSPTDRYSETLLAFQDAWRKASELELVRNEFQGHFTPQELQKNPDYNFLLGEYSVRRQIVRELAGRLVPLEAARYLAKQALNESP